MKDDGARGAEITVMDNAIPYCVDCQVKHAADMLEHVDPNEKDKYGKALWIYDKVCKQVGMNKMQADDYRKIRELEHKFEDGLTVLRDLRHKAQASPSYDRPTATAKTKEECLEVCRATGFSEKKCKAECK